MSETAEPPAPPAGTPLETPLRNGTITHLSLRKPKAGEMRGLQLQSLMQGDVNAVLALLPRITVPPITQPEAEELEIADLAALTGEVQGFFMTGVERAMMAKVMGVIDQGTPTD